MAGRGQCVWEVMLLGGVCYLLNLAGVHGYTVLLNERGGWPVSFDLMSAACIIMLTIMVCLKFYSA